MHPFKVLCAAGSCVLFAASSAYGCTAESMATNEYGLITKVVAGSDQILAYEDEGESAEAFQLELLRPYFVICESGDYYRVTDLQTEIVEEAETGNVGFVRRDQVHNWDTREALSFSDIAFLEERPEIVAWDDEAVLQKFMETGNRNLHPPAFKENLEATRLRERATRPYPVLSSEEMLLRKTAKKRVYEVLLPTAITPEDKIVIEEGDVETVQKTLSSATILVVFDATASMDKFALETAKSIGAALGTLPKDVRDGSTMGFLFYRDGVDSENLVPVAPIPVDEAAASLEKAAAFMKGGGDAPEPILDAMYYAQNIYDWSQAGRKIIIGVLNDDAKPETTGELGEGKIPAGLDAINIAKSLADDSTPVITVQAGPNAGPALVSTLSTLAEETGGSFVKWNPGSTERDIAAQVTKLMTAAAGAAIEEGKQDLTRMEIDLRGYASIPLEVMDGEKLDRLREAGVNFNISKEEGGVLVQEGYIVESPDLLAPEISIEKETLVNLINLYSVLATTGVGETEMLQAISEAVAAIAGEDFDPNDTIEEIVEKKLGIQFRSDLLSFDVNFLPAMVPNERLAYAARIQEAGEVLGQYLEANLTEFDTQIAVWMPVSILP